MKTKLITLPKIPSQVSIDSAWIAASIDLRTKAVEISAVADDDAYTTAAGMIQQLTRKSNEMETIRKGITKPFLDAQRMVKKLADDATKPLRDECDRLKRLSSDYFREQERLRRQEQAESEKAQREEAERQIVEHEKAVQVGLEDADSEPDIQLPDYPENTFTIAPKSYDVRIRKDLVATVYEESEVTREFCTSDDRKIKAFLKDHKDFIMAECDKNEGVYNALPGIRVTLEIKVQSR